MLNNDKDTKAFTEEFFSGLSDEAMRTIRYSLEAYLKDIETKIRGAMTRGKYDGIGGPGWTGWEEPGDRDEVKHEELMYLYTIASQLSTMLFNWKGLQNRHQVDF